MINSCVDFVSCIKVALTSAIWCGRCQETAEEGVRKTEAELLKVQAELARLKQEHRHAQSIREDLTRDAATTQKQLEGLSRIKIWHSYERSELRCFCA